MRLSPVLIEKADDSLRTEVLLASFSATTKKSRQLVLRSAIECKRPPNAEELTPWLSMLAGDQDKSISALANKLIKQWAMQVDPLPEEKTETQGFWQETPAIWQMPPFELGEISPQVLTGLAAELVNKPAIVHDVTAEHFLAMAIAVAYDNPEVARMSLRGLRSDQTLVSDVACWVKEEQPGYGFDVKNPGGIRQPLKARDYVAGIHLGKLPCLLSTPSFVDLSISVSDLANRLSVYLDLGP